MCTRRNPNDLHPALFYSSALEGAVNQVRKEQQSLRRALANYDEYKKRLIERWVKEHANNAKNST